MSGKKYQIFVSSTFNDLKEERENALLAILKLGHFPSGMEFFPATGMKQFDYIEKMIERCDYYVLIIAARYGSLVDETGLSYTEREFDFAVGRGKHILVFPHKNPTSLIQNADVDRDAFVKLSAFRDKACNERLGVFWETPTELHTAIFMSLFNAFQEHPQTGWVRDDMGSPETLLRQINELRIENADLKKQIDMPSLNHDFIVSVLEESFTYNIVYTWYQSPSMNSRGSTQKRSEKFTQTLKSLFLIYGQTLTSPGSHNNCIEEITNDHRNTGATYVSMQTSDGQLLKLRLIGFGLISAAGVEKGNELVCLTDLGLKVILELTRPASS